MEEPMFAAGHCFTGPFGFDKGIDAVCVARVADINDHAETLRADMVDEVREVLQIFAVLNRELDGTAIQRIKHLGNSHSRKIIGVEVNECRVRKMKTKWGSCNVEAGRIWINLELIKKPQHCLEYIIVHEMVHFLEHHHNDSFISLLGELMPNWRSYKDELNQFPLAYAEWNH